MAAKTTYIATDPDGGEHTRTTHRTYTHAVLVYTFHYKNDPDYWADLLPRMRTWDQPERLAKAEADAAKATGEREWLCYGFSGRLDLAQKEAAKVAKHRKPGERVEIVPVAVK